MFCSANHPIGHNVRRKTRGVNGGLSSLHYFSRNISFANVAPVRHVEYRDAVMYMGLDLPLVCSVAHIFEGSDAQAFIIDFKL